MEGSGAYTHYYFMNGNYAYKSDVGAWGCKDCNLNLTVYKDAKVNENNYLEGEEIFSQKPVMIYWSERVN